MLLKERRSEARGMPAVEHRVLGQGTRPKASSECPAPEGPVHSVLVQHGIHAGAYPVVGMTVAQARATLSPLMNIDPAAIAILDGYPVADEQSHMITTADELLAFVKSAAAKG